MFALKRIFALTHFSWTLCYAFVHNASGTVLTDFRLVNLTPDQSFVGVEAPVGAWLGPDEFFVAFIGQQTNTSPTAVNLIDAAGRFSQPTRVGRNQVRAIAQIRASQAGLLSLLEFDNHEELRLQNDSEIFEIERTGNFLTDIFNSDVNDDGVIAMSSRTSFGRTISWRNGLGDATQTIADSRGPYARFGSIVLVDAWGYATAIQDGSGNVDVLGFRGAGSVEKLFTFDSGTIVSVVGGTNNGVAFALIQDGTGRTPAFVSRNGVEIFPTSLDSVESFSMSPDLAHSIVVGLVDGHRVITLDGEIILQEGEIYGDQRLLSIVMDASNSDWESDKLLVPFLADYGTGLQAYVVVPVPEASAIASLGVTTLLAVVLRLGRKSQQAGCR